MVKRLLLAALTAGSLGVQFTADAICRSCQGGVCRIVRKHAAKKAQLKNTVKPVAKKTHHACRSCKGGVCHIVRKQVIKNAEHKNTPKRHHSRGGCKGGCCRR